MGAQAALKRPSIDLHGKLRNIVTACRICDSLPNLGLGIGIAKPISGETEVGQLCSFRRRARTKLKFGLQNGKSIYRGLLCGTGSIVTSLGATRPGSGATVARSFSGACTAGSVLTAGR